jgi:hypothetical protein
MCLYEGCYENHLINVQISAFYAKISARICHTIVTAQALVGWVG